MAYLLTHFWPGGTEEQYRVTLAAVTEAGGGSRGEKFHAAGPTEGGFLIVGVQESKDAAESFLHNTLMPLLPIEGGLVGPPEERSAEIVNSEGLSD
jgi:hypothetical protein